LRRLEAAGSLIVFEEAFSTHTHTAPVLTLALTGADQSNPNGFIQSPSLIDVAKSADFRVTWITNQVIYGAWDNAVSILAQSADELISINRFIGKTSMASEQDEELVDLLRDVLARSSDHNQLIVVHLAGSHSPYCSRFPEAFARYTGDLERGVFGGVTRAASARSVNCYDNSVLYNDHVIGLIIDSIASYLGDDLSGGLLYFSDHGEDVVGGRGHNSSTFSYTMTRIPMMVWLSPGYRTIRSEIGSQLAVHQREVFPTDHIFDTMLGIMGIRSVSHQPSHDLTRSEYQFPDSLARSVRGKHAITAPENELYIQRRNISNIIARQELQRLIPHRLNSLGAVRAALSSGMTGFEIDVYFRKSGEYFEVGHDSSAMSGLNLEQFLQVATNYRVEKLWLDIKNAASSDLRALRSELLRLDKMFGLQQVAIVESSSRADDWSDIQTAGFGTSYYIDFEAAVSSDPEEWAQDIARIVQNTGVSAISFDARAYQLVKNHLEPLLSRDIIYHVWDLTLFLKNPYFQELLEERVFYEDQRVQTLLIGYTTPYRL
ncbi:MAG: sulfatase-like hydrolase/transferase, partial [Rhodothermia bacterium]|nr:sulfatase-like hydrolase/transferase [Rhodothermia bacterium]